jgi:hypothetical protein
MTISKKWLNLSLLAGTLMSLVSAAGLFSNEVYMYEHVSWAAQGFGQDIVNLGVVFPALIITSFLIKKGSERAILVWLGLVVYMAYSYVLYAFFMHFGPWFLVYIAVLGISFYTLVGSIIELVNQGNGVRGARKGPSIYLFANGFIFATLWLIEIISSSWKGEVPKSATDVGLWINPVQVMDLAFLLPAMIMTSIWLWQRKNIGYLFAVPMMIFSVTMAAAIISMIFTMKTRGVLDTFGPAPMMAMNVIFGLYFVYRFYKYKE